MSKIKLVVCKYHDELISKLDLAVETAIANNHLDENLRDGLNKHRDAFISEIRGVEAYNLRSLADLKHEHDNELGNDDLFSKFCFFIELPILNQRQVDSYDKLAEQEIGLRLIVTDKYLNESQISCFEASFNYLLGMKSADIDIGLFFEKLQDVSVFEQMRKGIF
jgi:hypothetical protein